MISAFAAAVCAMETPPPIPPPETFDVPGLPPDEAPQSSAPNQSASHYFDNQKLKRADMFAQAAGADKSAIILVNGSNVEIEKIRILKTGSSTNAAAGNAIGLNAAVAVCSGSQLFLGSGEIKTNSGGANALSVCGNGSKSMLKNLEIKTESNFSRALFASGGGLIEAENINIETRGGNSAALEALGATISAANLTVNTRGQYSPAIRSEGEIAVRGCLLNARDAEAVVIEGPAAVEVENSTLFARKNGAVLICQRVPGGPQNGAAVFNMTGGILATCNKSIFCVTNASCTINLNSVDIRFRPSMESFVPDDPAGAPIDDDDLAKVILVNARQSQLGTPDYNGGYVTINAVNQVLPGVIYADAISSVALNLQSSRFIGTTNGNVVVTLDENSSWVLTADAHVQAIQGSVNNVVPNGHQIFYSAPRP